MSVAPPQFKQYLDVEGAVGYIRSLGFANADDEMVRYHAYETKKLPLPILIKRRSYWAKKDLDTLIEKLSNRSRVDDSKAKKRAQARRNHSNAVRRFEAAEQALREIDNQP